MAATTGPSKEELQNYYNNNRQYFDELARYYKEIDPKYYNQYIAPFYSPFARVSSGGKSVKAIMTVMVAIAVLGVGLVAALVFFLSSEQSDTRPTNKKPSDKISAPRDSIKTEPEEPPKAPSKKNERRDRPRPIERNR